VDDKKRELTSRNEQIVRMRKDGLTYIEIGGRFGLSQERVRQVVKKKDNRNRTDGRKERPPVMDLPLTTADVARMLNVHTNTVRRWSDRGVLRTYRIGPRQDRRFRRTDVDIFVEE
jgi:excisionase family DNA binding protein